MKALTIAAIAILSAVLSSPAYSQGGTGREMGPTKEEPKANPEKKKAEDKAYNDALSRIPPKEFDPWQSVREKEMPPTPPKKSSR